MRDHVTQATPTREQYGLAHSFSRSLVVLSFLNGSRWSNSFSLLDRDLIAPQSLLYLEVVRSHTHTHHK